jgi:hypothetical protein
MDERAKRLLSINDPVLAPLIEAAGEEDRARALELVLVEHVKPVIQQVIGRARGSTLRNEDFEDAVSTVILRLVARLQLIPIYPEEAIARLEDFVATLTYHAVYDLLRRRFPERTRLKNRLRYILTHDPRLAMWPAVSGSLAGRREWIGRESHAERGAITKTNASRSMLGRHAQGEALLALFDRSGKPLLFDDLVSTVATLWDVVDIEVQEPSEGPADTGAGPMVQYEARQYLAVLWEEVRELPSAQRAALLLNLRDGDGFNALALFVLLGIASLEEIAEAVGMTPERLVAIWNDLPIDDLTIATTLELTRQQVINLRKAARARLGRRMTQRERGRKP